MSLKEKLNSIINTPLSSNNRSNNNLIHYTKINNGNKGEIISEVKEKINEFKLNRQYNQPVDLLNFEVSREALSKYYKNNSSRDLNQSFNKIKNEIEFNKNNESNKKEKNNNDLIFEKNKENKSNEKKNFLNIDIKNIFKSNNDNNKHHKNRKLNKSFDKIKIKNNNINNNNKKEYIKLFNFKENNDYINNNNENNEYNKDDKIKTQINLFVKQLNFSPSNNDDENSSNKKKKFQSKININNNNFYNNYSTFNPSLNNNFNSNIKLEDIKKINKYLININDPSLLNNDILSELKILNNKLNIIFNNN